MLNSIQKNLIVLLIACLFSNFYCEGQTFVLREGFKGEVDRFIMSRKLSKNILSKYDSRKYIYVSENSSYITFLPNFKNEDLKYEFSNFPTFTYLKDFDLVIVKKQDKKEVLTHQEFAKTFKYKPTDTYKNYFGTKAEKYVSENNFYDYTLLVAEGESNIDSNPFLKILKELKLLDLNPSQKVVAITYLGIEFDINNISFKRTSSQSINDEIYPEDDSEEDPNQTLDYVQIHNAEQMVHLLNKEYTFDSEQFNIYTTNSYKEETDSIKVLVNSKLGYKLSIQDEKFTMFMGTHFTRGVLNEDGSLQPEEYFAFNDTSTVKELDYKDFKILSKTTEGNRIELVLHGNKSFWDFRRYIIHTDKKEDEDMYKFLLPDNLIIDGYIESITSFSARYSRFDYEMTSILEKKKPLEQSKTFFIHE